MAVHLTDRHGEVEHTFILPSIVCAWDMLKQVVAKHGYMVVTFRKFSGTILSREEVYERHNDRPIPFFVINGTNVGVEALVRRKDYKQKRKR